MKSFLIIYLTILFFVETKNLRRLEPIEERYKKLTADEIKAALPNKNIYVVDARNNKISNSGYLANSLLLPIYMSFTRWLKVLIPKNSKIIIICDNNSCKEALEKTETLGCYTILGYALYQEIIKKKIYKIKKAEYNENTLKDVEKLVMEKKYLLDVRDITEYKETGVIKESHLIPLASHKTQFKNVPKDVDIYLFCIGGGRALLTATFLQRAGYTNRLVVMRDGLSKTIKQGYPLVPYSE